VSISLDEQIIAVEHAIDLINVCLAQLQIAGKKASALKVETNLVELQAVLKTLQKLDGVESLFPPEEDQEK
jgi:hypothetical protein